jgi:peroxiredoxin
MRKTLLSLLILAGAWTSATARDGYKIQVKLNGMKDTMVYLAHYYAKPLPTIYRTDSARFDKNGVATMESKTKITGGIYIILPANKTAYFEFLLNNGDEMSMTADMKNLPTGVVFKNSPENERFLEYENFLTDYGKKQQELMAELAAAKTKADSAAVREKGSKVGKELTSYRLDYAQKHPGTLLANIFNALEMPQVPEGKHLLPNGKEDSMFAYHYFKDHYWEKFDFKDDRLIHTPIYEARLDEYFNKIVMQLPDSVEKEMDRILAKTRGTEELFKYTLSWLSTNVQNSKVMGMDEAFVYLVENYYMKGDASWLDHATLEKYIERAGKIAPNVIGNLAPELTMIDINKKKHALSEIKSKYTLLVFWSPDCGVCQHEVPILDSVYKAALKAKGVTVYAVRTEGTEQQWQDFIKKHDLDDWINVYDPEHTSNYRAQYDVYATPVMYLLDEKKIIRGKRFDHTNVMDVINFLENRGKTSAR